MVRVIYRIKYALFAVAVLVLPASAKPAPQVIDGKQVLRDISTVAGMLSRRDTGNGKADAAGIWRGWSALYGRAADQCPAGIPGDKFCARQVMGLLQMAVQADRVGNTRYARLCRASADMWGDIGRQVMRGSKDPTVRFPDEFLQPIAGAPATPWESTRIVAGSPPAAPPTLTRAQKAQLLEQLLRQSQAANARPAATPPFNPYTSSGDLIAQLNSMSQSDVNRMMGQSSFWDQFTPYWYRRDGGNVLGQFGIGKDLMRTLGTTDPRKILDPNGLNGIQGQLRQAQVMGNIAGGQAAQNKVYNSVDAHDRSVRDSNALLEQLLRLNEVEARTGVTR
jgi:hypothetical protein